MIRPPWALMRKTLRERLEESSNFRCVSLLGSLLYRGLQSVFHEHARSAFLVAFCSIFAPRQAEQRKKQAALKRSIACSTRAGLSDRRPSPTLFASVNCATHPTCDAYGRYRSHGLHRHRTAKFTSHVHLRLHAHTQVHVHYTTFTSH